LFNRTVQGLGRSGGIAGVLSFEDMPTLNGTEWWVGGRSVGGICVGIKRGITLKGFMGLSWKLGEGGPAKNLTGTGKTT